MTNELTMGVCGWCGEEITDGMEFCTPECRDKCMAAYKQDMEKMQCKEVTCDQAPCPKCGCAISLSQLHCAGMCSDCEDAIMSVIMSSVDDNLSVSKS